MAEISVITNITCLLQSGKVWATFVLSVIHLCIVDFYRWCHGGAFVCLHVCFAEKRHEKYSYNVISDTFTIYIAENS